MRTGLFAGLLTTVIATLLGVRAHAGEPAGGTEAVIATFSIVGCDPATGEVGAAVASMYPAVGKVVPFVRAGAGAFCSQYHHNPQFGPKALVMLEAGMRPEDILAALLRDDKKPDYRQLAIIDLQGRAANRNPTAADENGLWWGGATGRHYAVQGNTLAGRTVIVAMAAGYEAAEGTVADKLMAALEAGDHSGGDHRGRLAAGLRVAKPGVDGLWIEIDVDESDDAVNELMKKYKAWKSK
ncbi:MAG: DUF1028 domain-containing protein [Planctomycetaceae bacterium]|nr:DUF1028 domain-containing protein [Planctomycetaceae bacterium]